TFGAATIGSSEGSILETRSQRWTSFSRDRNYILMSKENFDAWAADRFHSTQSGPRGSDAPPESRPYARGHEGADPLGRRRALGRQPHDLSRARAWPGRERPG